MTGMTRSRATAAVPTASATCVTILKPAHRPKAREQRLRRARDRGRLAAGVVADDGQGAAGAGDADEVAVAERVGGAVEAGRLAVPHRQHAVVLGAGQLRGQLAPPGGGGAQLLVQAGHVANVVLLDELPVAGQLLVEAAERRALV